MIDLVTADDLRAIGIETYLEGWILVIGAEYMALMIETPQDSANSLYRGE